MGHWVSDRPDENGLSKNIVRFVYTRTVWVEGDNVGICKTTTLFRVLGITPFSSESLNQRPGT